MLHPPHGLIEKDDVHGDRRRTWPVKVNLRGHFADNADSGIANYAGLDVDRIVDGLTYGWWDTEHGGELVVVNFEIPYADSHLKPLVLSDQIVSSRWVRTQR